MWLSDESESLGQGHWGPPEVQVPTFKETWELRYGSNVLTSGQARITSQHTLRMLSNEQHDSNKLYPWDKLTQRGVWISYIELLSQASYSFGHWRFMTRTCTLYCRLIYRSDQSTTAKLKRLDNESATPMDSKHFFFTSRVLKNRPKN